MPHPFNIPDLEKSSRAHILPKDTGRAYLSLKAQGWKKKKKAIYLEEYVIERFLGVGAQSDGLLQRFCPVVQHINRSSWNETWPDIYTSPTNIYL